MSEVFTYLGRQPQEHGAVHAFLHTQMTPMTREAIVEMAGGVMNNLIHVGMIKNDDKVITFNLMSDTQSVFPVLVDHVDFKHLEKTSLSEGLSDFLLRLFRAPRSVENGILSIEVFIKNGNPYRYETCDIDNTEHVQDLINIIREMGNVKMLPFEPLHEIYTKKPIPYLNHE